AVTSSPTFTCARFRTFSPARNLIIEPSARRNSTWRVSWSMAATVAVVDTIPSRTTPPTGGAAGAGATAGAGAPEPDSFAVSAQPARPTVMQSAAADAM